MPSICTKIICALGVLLATAAPTPGTPALASTDVTIMKKKAPGTYRESPPDQRRARCKCPFGFERMDESCVKTVVTGKPEAVCPSGILEDGKCRTRSAEAFRCPDGFETICNAESTAKSKCCRRTEAQKIIFRCPEGTTETTDGDCKRLTRFPPSYECPLGYRYDEGYCVRTEPGHIVPACGTKSQLTAHNTCLAIVPGEIVYECPEGFHCASSTKISSFCKSCKKRELAPVSCECGIGTVESDGLCYQAETYQDCVGKVNKKDVASTAAVDSDEDAVVEKKKDKKCETTKSKCSCQADFHLVCKGKDCHCVKEESAAVVRRCLGFDDGSGNCVRQMESAPIFQCGEGQECESVGKNECKCVYKIRKDSTVNCGDGVLIGGDCFSVDHIPRTQHCQDGFDVACRGSECQCERNLFTSRAMMCESATDKHSKACATLSDPEFICREGQLINGECVRLSYSVQLCDA
ncbi:putative oocyst wall protein COWP [Neospora caninum Liverpool]|uniref:Oocyst wall protein COWP, putative n=1 Tax=Neospora caninum (strain Liverpool) TaxID=572307 RepID=F0V865_NEOCL|nr:putative oocyst wall protein COWP [Neospora caninum Liverpool]CBZ49906.1 putative oocyst wall protein COWP [Neospora caninum Liverpool]CEL64493.1 TPA: oocyst wall protein COWP, putative [Neospora caninum Liverpool]|eukprot:XP_003879941.1 putative oocyst wall protein COWP [Neospora caninum Liverpool]